MARDGRFAEWLTREVRDLGFAYITVDGRRGLDLEREHAALRLSPDEWITRLFGEAISGEALDSARDPVEAALWDLAARVLVLGLDVILENGFWSRSEREEYRARAAQLGARSELHFTHATQAELLRRLATRNAERPWGTFQIDEGLLRSWWDVFEAPGDDELQPREAGLRP